MKFERLTEINKRVGAVGLALLVSLTSITFSPNTTLKVEATSPTTISLKHTDAGSKTKGKGCYTKDVGEWKTGETHCDCHAQWDGPHGPDSSGQQYMAWGCTNGHSGNSYDLSNSGGFNCQVVTGTYKYWKHDHERNRFSILGR